MEKNIYLKIAELRSKIKNSSLRKSGFNKFANFDYYELGDFLPLTIDFEKELGLLSMFSCNSERADLIVVNCENTNEKVIFTTHVKEADMKGVIEIQKAGAENTYAKRYVYLNYLNLTEPDQVDRLDQSVSAKTPTTTTKKATSKEKQTPQVATKGVEAEKTSATPRKLKEREQMIDALEKWENQEIKDKLLAFFKTNSFAEMSDDDLIRSFDRMTKEPQKTKK